MKSSLLLLSLLLTVPAGAGTVDGQVSAVDPRFSTVTVVVRGKPLVVQVRPDTEVYVDGNKAALAAVLPKMRAKVTGNDPSVATRLEATSPVAPLPAGAAAEDGPARRAAMFGVKVISSDPDSDSGKADMMERELKNSRWRMNDGRTFVLHADGTTEGNWIGARGKWKVTGPLSAEWSFSADPKQVETVTFPDADAALAKWKEANGLSEQTAKRVFK